MRLSKRSKSFISVLLGKLAIVFGACCLSVGAAESRLAHFISRQGHRLMDGPRPFRFMGANMPGLVCPYDFTLGLPERMRLPTPWEQEDAFRTLDQMNLRVVRTWNLPMRPPGAAPAPWHYVLGPGQFNEQAFRTVDHLLALANRYGVRVIFDFTAEAGDYLGGIGTYAAYRGKKREAFYTDPQLREDYRATLRFVLDRVNTVTGIPYREDKAILAWQFGNEMHSAPDAWLSEMAAYIKQLDPNHLVADTRHIPGRPYLIDPNIDLLTTHLYANPTQGGSDWAATCRREVTAIGGQRPFFVGEFGPYVDGKMFTSENAPAKLRAFLDECLRLEGVAGALLWSMYFHREEGGFYWHQIFTYPSVWSFHWPGFARAAAQAEEGILCELRQAAFRIQGLSVPPLPVPQPPELLPFAEVPMFSWKGSAGASGYDIQRAPTGDGPWTTIAQGVSDADVAYRPLFSDRTARAGQTWYYRVLARNASGNSPPSNVVGPVTIRRVCLADELQDFSLAAGRSPGLQLNNQYNALYAEYLFRAWGRAGDFLEYEIPGLVESVRLIAFFADGPADGEDFEVQVETADGSWAHVDLGRTARLLPRPPGGPAGNQRRTLAEYLATKPKAGRRLRIVWKAPAELDRVEIFFH